LVYVALTRARQYLLVTGHAPKRSVGLAGTTPHAALWQAAETLAPEATPLAIDASVGAPLALRTFGRVPDDMIRGVRTAAAAVSAAADDDRDAQGIARTLGRRLARLRVGGPKRELRMFAPSHGGAPRPAASAAELPAIESDGPLAAERGTFLHAGFEALMRGTPFVAAAAWAAMGHPGDARWRRHVESELEALRGDPTLTAWRERAWRLEPELPFVFRDDDKLMRGAIDLLVEEAPGRFLVVDYKTTRFHTSPGEAALRAFAAERGYLDQVGIYVRAVRALEPAAKVRGAIFFTSVGCVVEMGGPGELALRPSEARPRNIE
jgi:ATP-dependent exoDNAse (exonuclease V) beta subunit